MTPALIMGLPLLAGLVVALVAERRNWAPPLWAALCAGAVVRLVIMLAAAQDPAQPYDFIHDFPDAADAVRDGFNPTMHLRDGGWHFLPLLAYVLAGQRELGDLLGLSWTVAGRIVPVLADLALIPLVARLAAGRGNLRAFQYALVPMGIMVSAIHGQLPPLTLLFGVAALVAAREGRVHLAGVLVGLSVTCTNWSVLLVPGVALALPAVRSRLAVLGWTAAVPALFLLSSSVFLDTPLTGLPDLVRGILSTRPVVGDWGWTALATGGAQAVDPTLGRIGTLILVIGLLAAGWWWRRADPVDLTLALLLVFLVLTYRLGAQYLMWPVVYLLARSGKGTWGAIIAASLWSVFGYLHLYQLIGMDWYTAHHWWAFSSWLVIPFLVYALPRRAAAAVPPSPEPVTPARTAG
ncbi:hypothetical protein Misp01_45920 [Microtetraspora sp. NBRC 13810]|uniref:hypothetical protein n=1 Tax=Microtetraspora sp. NBRC 13810 TaxID=3030990 RepID=UPI0024A47194|nr:hypothetical protein [Microtetraspora sp. NBRC 13810]GLW09463.1 hypothetical protein Misp01_45920 [Microtetraspora sp. NBRC 13810]